MVKYIHYCILLHKDIQQEWGSSTRRSAANKHGDKLMRTLPSSHFPPTHTRTVIINRKEAWNNITHNRRMLCLSVFQSSLDAACVHFFYYMYPFFFGCLEWSVSVQKKKKKKKRSNSNGKSGRQRGNTTKQNKKMTETDSDRKSEER